MVWASKVDDVIPFSGVESYVKELKNCIQQHRNNLNLFSNNYCFYCQSKSKSSISRGSVLFCVDKNHDHYSSDS